MTKISDFATLSPAFVDPDNDLIIAVDVSEAGAARDKKMTFAELAESMGAQFTITADGAVKVTP